MTTKLKILAGAAALAGQAAGTAMADGVDAGARMEERLHAARAAGDLEGLHAVLVRLNGETFAEAYFEGEDEDWGRDLGMRTHGPESLHDLRSVTKSITALLYGIALERGLVPAPEAGLYAQFPEYADLAADPARAAIAVGHALNMTMGLHWDESLPYSDPRNSEIAMERAPDRLRFVLEQPVVQAPGAAWIYSGGATALIGALIARGVGMTLDDFAKEALFDPLGIENWRWHAGPDGVISAASGLRLTARDLALIGEMVRAGGSHEGRRIVPEAWIAELFKPKAMTPGGLAYSNFWYVAGEPPTMALGLGNGGQRFSVNPGVGLVMVVFAGRYNDWDAWELGVKVSQDFLSPALEAAEQGRKAGRRIA